MQSGYVYPYNTTNKTLEYESSDNNVATVDENGNVKAISNGECYITAKATDGSDEYARCHVTVKAGFRINVKAGDNGKISPYGDCVVNEGENITFSITPNKGYEIDNLTVDGIMVENESSYTFNNVTCNHSIEVSFKPIDYGDIINEDIPESGIIPDGLWFSTVDSQIYTGTEIRPEIRVYDRNKLLRQDMDYDIRYTNNINVNEADVPADAPSIFITGINSYDFTQVIMFAIDAVDISDENVIKVNNLILTVNGKTQKPVPEIYFGENKLKQKKDFILTYSDNSAGAYKEVGKYQVDVYGIGNYCGNRKFEIEITNRKHLNKANISEIKAQKYNNGMEITPDITVKYGKKLLQNNVDYEVKYSNNINAGTAKVTVTGMGEYCGTKTVSFKINGVSINKAKVKGLSTGMIYTGDKILQQCTLSVAGVTESLKEGEDYTVTYQNNINAGKATIIFKGINGYTGSFRKTFTINKLDIADENIQVQLQSEMAFEKGGAKAKPILKINDMLLKEGKDYTLIYNNNNKLTDSASVVIKGKGNFKGSRRPLTYSVVKQNLDRLTLIADDKEWKSVKGNYKIQIKITDTNGKTLVVGKDYDKKIEYSYSDGTLIKQDEIVPAGTEIIATIRQLDTANYSGEVKIPYRIVQKSINKAKITVSKQTYTGKQIKPGKDDIIVKISGIKLKEDDYEIVGYGKNLINTGSNTVTLKGVGNYGGTRTVTYKIVKK